jgi:hypothetical protein
VDDLMAHINRRTVKPQRLFHLARRCGQKRCVCNNLWDGSVLALLLAPFVLGLLAYATSHLQARSVGTNSAQVAIGGDK